MPLEQPTLTPTALDITAASIAAIEDLTPEQRDLLTVLVRARSRTRRAIGLRDFKTAARREQLGLPDYWDIRDRFGSLAAALRVLDRVA